jgi:hypothetical protein
MPSFHVLCPLSPVNVDCLFSFLWRCRLVLYYFGKKMYNTGIILYASIVNNTGIWSPSTGDPSTILLVNKNMQYQDI